MAIRTYGPNAVDWEARVDVDRLRTDRLQRLRQHLDASELGALLTFDFSNIRYMTATHIGTWAMDKLIRFSLLTRNTDPISWDFGSAAKHHKLYNPWLDVTSAEMDADPNAPHEGALRPRLESGARAGISTLRGAFTPDAGIAEEVARKIKRELEKFGVADQPLGVDVIELPILFALQQQGIQVVDGQQVCAVAYQGRVACFEITRGTLNWSLDVSSLYGLSGDGKNIYVTDDKGSVQALDRSTGASVWKQDRLAERKIGGPQMIGTEFVAVIDVEGYVHLLATSNGAYVGRLQTDGSPATSQPALFLSSILWQSANGTLYAVTAK